MEQRNITSYAVNTGKQPKQNPQTDELEQQPSAAEEDDGTPVLDEEDLEENDLSEDEADNVDWDEPQGKDIAISPENDEEDDSDEDDDDEDEDIEDDDENDDDETK